VFGSWNFIIVQTTIVALWIGPEPASRGRPVGSLPVHPAELGPFDPGRLRGPLILLSQNRQADTDRIKADRDYRVNQTALQYLTVLQGDAHGFDCVDRAQPAAGQNIAVAAGQHPSPERPPGLAAT
jgi:hypothetical protein